MHLTKRYIDAARHAGAKKWDVRWDDAPRGLGLRIYPSGEKVFVLRYRHAGKTKLFTLGRFGDDLTLEEARDEATEQRKLARRGVDLVAKKRQDHVKGETFTAVAKQWLRDDQAGHRSYAETERIINNHCAPLASLPLGKITKGQILDLLRDTRDGATPISRKHRGRKGAPYMANRVLSALRRFFNWCIEQDKLPASPVASIKPVARETSRTRVLSNVELGLVWRCAGKYPYGPLVQLLILTGARREEVGAMRWSEIEGDVWAIPGERTKNRKPHRIPLVPKAIELLNDLPRMEGCDFCFTTQGSGPFDGYSKAKAALDNRITEEAAKDDLKVSPWVLHDIRRTVASGLACLGIQPVVIGALLNHSPTRLIGVTAVYARFGYEVERRRALEAWAAHVNQIVSGAPAEEKVVRLAEARAS